MSDVAGKTEGLDRVSIDTGRDTLGDLVIRAGYQNERIIITRHGKPTVALVSMADLETLLSLDGVNQ